MRRRLAHSPRVRPKRRRTTNIYLSVGLPGAVFIFILRWLGLLWWIGWIFGALFVYFAVGYIAADMRAHQTFGNRRERRNYVQYAMGAALVSWFVGWVSFSITLLLWMMFQDLFGEIAGLVVWIPWTLPMAVLAAPVGASLAQ